MPNSNGEQSEIANQNQEAVIKKTQKRKRNKNRKKSGPKIENLVSKTFQAKLEANCSQNKCLIEKIVIQSDESKVSLNANECKYKVTLKDKASLPSPSCVNQINTKDTVNEVEESKFINNKGLNEVDTTKNSFKMVHNSGGNIPEKSREEILAEREAKRLAKQQAKNKNKASASNTQVESEPKKIVPSTHPEVPVKNEKSKLISGQENIRNKNCKPETTQENSPGTDAVLAPTIGSSEIDKKNKKTDLTKAERRALQEAQRAAKAESASKKPKAEKKAATEVIPARFEKLHITKPIKDCKVKLFNHLEICREDSNLFVNNSQIHPIIVRLGEQYSKRTIVGSNARCISFLNALKTVIQDFETPAKKEFARSLETIIKNSVDHLHKCRPLAVAVCNAYKHIKHVLTQLPMDQPESELKERLCHFIDTYIENQIEKAAQAISSSVQDKISNGDVILTFGCSSLINYIFEEAHRRHVDFRVIVVDSRPFSEGQELLRRLTVKEIPCTYVLINAVGFVMPEVTKILLGAHALLSNGYVMARTGTAQVALVARSFNVPVLVCCETHKFSERFQTDAIVYNELGNPNDLVISDKCRLANWKSQNKLSLLNLNYDITPPELVTAVVTEVAILPCTSVPVILRIKPTEIGY